MLFLIMGNIAIGLRVKYAFGISADCADFADFTPPSFGSLVDYSALDLLKHFRWEFFPLVDCEHVKNYASL